MRRPLASEHLHGFQDAKLLIQPYPYSLEKILVFISLLFPVPLWVLFPSLTFSTIWNLCLRIFFTFLATVIYTIHTHTDILHTHMPHTYTYYLYICLLYYHIRWVTVSTFVFFLLVSSTQHTVFSWLRGQGEKCCLCILIDWVFCSITSDYELNTDRTWGSPSTTLLSDCRASHCIHTGSSDFRGESWLHLCQDWECYVNHLGRRGDYLQWNLWRRSLHLRKQEQVLLFVLYVASMCSHVHAGCMCTLCENQK